MTESRWKKLSLEGDGQGGKTTGRISYLNTEMTQTQGKSCGGVSWELKLNFKD